MIYTSLQLVVVTASIKFCPSSFTIIFVRIFNTKIHYPDFYGKRKETEVRSEIENLHTN